MDKLCVHMVFSTFFTKLNFLDKSLCLLISICRQRGDVSMLGLSANGLNGSKFTLKQSHCISVVLY